MPSTIARVAFDHIYDATCSRPDFEHVGMLTSLRRRWSVQGHGGPPCLAHDLTWAEGLPLLVTGALAGLRLELGRGSLCVEGGEVSGREGVWTENRGEGHGGTVCGCTWESV